MSHLTIFCLEQTQNFVYQVLKRKCLAKPRITVACAWHKTSVWSLTLLVSKILKLIQNIQSVRCNLPAPAVLGYYRCQVSARAVSPPVTLYLSGSIAPCVSVHKHKLRVVPDALPITSLPISVFSNINSSQMITCMQQSKPNWTQAFLSNSSLAKCLHF